MNSSNAGSYPPGVQVILNIFTESAIPFTVRVFDSPARQASQAAALIGCPLGAIVKSLVFEQVTSGELMMVLVSGINRADLQALHKITGEKVKPAHPETVLAETGYPVGAVPPMGLQGNQLVVMDADLLLFEQVWASAGAEHILMGISPGDLQRFVNGQIYTIKQEL
jgi:Cys-tRNA(Pro) deacylase